MKNFVMAALFGFGLLAGPSIASAASAEKPMQMAQVDMRVGPNGVRIDAGGDRDRFERRDRMERRDRWDRRDRRVVERRVFVRPERCRTIIVRHPTRYGYRTERIRRCG